MASMSKITCIQCLCLLIISVLLKLWAGQSYYISEELAGHFEDVLQQASDYILKKLTE